MKINTRSTNTSIAFAPQDSLIQVSDKLYSSTLEIMKKVKTEEDLKIGFEKILEPVLHIIGISANPRYEKTILTSGRADSIHGQVIIEYEPPSSFNSKRNIDHAYEQLVGYLKGEAEERKDSLFLLDPKLIGVGFDGEQIFFVQYQGDKRRPKTKLESKEFILTGPYPFSPQTARTLLSYIRALSRRLLTAENLSEIFGPQSRLAPKVVSAFADALEHWDTNPRIRTFFNEWKRLFGIVYGEQFNTHQAEEAKKLSLLYGVTNETDLQELLFCVHTYFVFLMKLIAAELLTISETSFQSSFSYDLANTNKQILLSKLKDIEEGGIYSKRGISNFLEGDFFRWYIDAIDSPRLEEAIRDVAREFSEFEPATTSLSPESTRDLLKKLYQYLVPQEVRHKLGEYYTPDWLAELVLDEVGYDGDTLQRVLDPACGSGTFLVLAIKRAREYGKIHREKAIETAKRITSRIWGFDLNPLAVIAARTNYLFALGDLIDELKEFEIPVFLADSVLWPERTGQMNLGPQGDSVEIPTSAKTFFVPRIWIKDKGFLMAKAAPLIEDMAKHRYTADEAMIHFRNNGLVFPPHEKVVNEFYKQILELEIEERNGIWARFLKNVFAPMIAEKFDFVVGNPPWIRWGYLSQEYRAATLEMWKSYGLFSLKGHAARLGGGEKDFSMLFTYATIDYYLDDNAKLGFLITQEVFKSKGAGEGFRRFSLGKDNNAKKFQVIKAHDLVDVQPFEGAANKTSAIFVKRGKVTNYPVPYFLWTRKKGVGKIQTDFTLSQALPFLQKKKLIAKPIGNILGSWQTLSEHQTNLSQIHGDNFYKAHQGADPQPYGVFLLELKNVLSEKNILIRNQFDSGKRKVHEVEERIESDLVYPAISGSDIERWGIKSNTYLLMTQNPKEREPFAEALMKKQWPQTYAYLTLFKDILLSRASKSIKELSERTAFYAMFGIGNYTVSKYKVVWKFMSNDMYATVISHFKTPFGYKIIIPTKTVALIATENEEEAHYLCAILNSTPVREFIKSYSSAGRGFGTPSVMQHIGIEKFDKKNPLHMSLSKSSKHLHDLKSKKALDEVEMLEKKNDDLVKRLYNIS